MAYVSNGIKISSSRDGINWNNSITIAMDEKYENRYVRYRRPSLAEMKDERVFLSFTRFEERIETLDGYDFKNRSLEVYYSILESDGVWSKPILIPVLKPTKCIFSGGYGGSNIRWKELEVSPLQPSCFTLKNGSIGIVAVDQNITTYELNGIWFTYLIDGETWSKPIHLSLNTAPFRGLNPKMFYSSSRDGYFLIYEHHLQDIVSITFSSDLKTWSKIKTFSMWPTHTSIAELKNGTVIFVYENFLNIYIT
jgi:hypothetical protein